MLGFVRVVVFVPCMVLLVFYALVAFVGMMCLMLCRDICELYGWRFPVTIVGTEDPAQ